jgi:hypothetical protein
MQDTDFSKRMLQLLSSLRMMRAKLEAAEAGVATCEKEIHRLLRIAPGKTREVVFGDIAAQVGFHAEYVVNTTKWENVRGKLKPGYEAVIDRHYQLNEEGAEWMQQNDPQQWGIVSQALLKVPGRFQVKFTDKQVAEGAMRKFSDLLAQQQGEKSSFSAEGGE